MMRWTQLLLLFSVSTGCHCGTPEPTPESDAGTIESDAAGEDVSAADQGPDGGEANGCGGTAVDEQEIAGWTIRLHHDSGKWTATPADADAPILESPPACEAEAVRLLDQDPKARHAFGNFEIDLTGENEWTGNTLALPELVREDEVVRVLYTVGDQAAAVAFSAGAKGGLRVELEHQVKSADLRIACASDTGFFGLGTQVTGMDLRGRTYPLWTQEQGNTKREDGGAFPFNNTLEAAYAPMGVLHSTAGWSGIVTHDGFTEVDLCGSEEAVFSTRSHRANPGFVFVNGTPKERMTAVSEYVGRVRADVPDWTFGLWVDSVTGPDRLAEVTDALRDNEIPASAIWSEDWIGGDESSFGFRLTYDWVWDEEHYPNLPDLVTGLHQRGFAFLAYFNTFLVNGTSVFPIAEEKGFFVNDENGDPILFTDPAFRQAGLINLFDQSAAAFMRTYQMTAVTEIGADGWMADFSEWYPLEAPDVWERHNLYPLVYQRQNEANMRAVRPDGNYVYFPRSGWASVNGGTGGVAPVMWGGDQNTSWTYDDGFPTIVPIGTHVGLSGVAIFGSDIAGYNTVGNLENTTKELWFRWAAAGALHPLMRTHHGGDHCANWNFDRDKETLEHLRRWSSIHTLLFPEFQRLYGDANTLGWPITRHPWLVEPDSPQLWQTDQYQWFLGDDILVAPVITEGATTRAVELPTIGWWPMFGDAPLDSASVDAPAEVPELPVFVRPGRALTLLSDPVDSFYGAEDGSTDLGDVVGYRVAMYPDATGTARTAGSEGPDVMAGGLDGFDLASVQVDGEDIRNCTGPLNESCIDGNVIWLVDVTTATVAAGNATIELTSDAPTTVALGVGGAAWGGFETPTAYSPNPDAPSWCPPEEM